MNEVFFFFFFKKQTRVHTRERKNILTQNTPQFYLRVMVTFKKGRGKAMVMLHEPN